MECRKRMRSRKVKCIFRNVPRSNCVIFARCYLAGRGPGRVAARNRFTTSRKMGAAMGESNIQLVY